VPETGWTVPDVRLPTLDGDSVALSDFRGRPIVVNFWASWCPPCREEFPVLEAARDRHLEDGLEILGITHNDGPTYSQAFVSERGAAWPMLVDADDRARNAFGAMGLPTSYFVDAHGVVRQVHFGPLDERTLEAELASITPGQPDDAPRLQP
jgi:peroxiredoxin